MATRRKRFDGKSAAAVVAGGLGGAGIAAGLGKLGVPPLLVGGMLGTAGIVGAAFVPGYGRLALGSSTGTGALVLLSAYLNRGKKAQASERVAAAETKTAPGKKGRNADLNDDVVALFEHARADLALDDEEREAARYYRAA